MEFQDKIAELRGLRRRVRLDGRRTALFRRQEFQERTETVQELQSQARVAAVRRRRHRPRAGRDDHQLFGLRQGNHRAVPAHAGTSGVLPGVLPAAKFAGGRRRLSRPATPADADRPRLGVALLSSGPRRRSRESQRPSSRPITDAMSSYHLCIRSSMPLRASCWLAAVQPRRRAARRRRGRRRRRGGAAAGRRRRRSLTLADQADRAGLRLHRHRCARCTRRRSSRKSRASSRASSSRPGDRVRAGAPLVQINAEKQQAARAQHRGKRAGTEADVEYWRQQVKRLESLVAAGAISRRNSTRRRTRCAPPRRSWPRSTRRCAKGASQLQLLPRRRARRPASSATFRSATGDRVTTHDDDHDHRRQLRPRGLHPGAARPLAGPARSACRCSCSTPTASSSRPTRSPSSRRAWTTRRRRCWSRALLKEAPPALRVQQFVRSRIVWRTAPGLTVPLTAVLRISGQYFCFVAEQGRQRPGRAAAPDCRSAN